MKLLLLLLGTASAAKRASRGLQDASGRYHVLVGLRYNESAPAVAQLVQDIKSVAPLYMKALVNESEYGRLYADPAVASIEEDAMVYPDAVFYQYGPDLAQADSRGRNRRSSGGQAIGACSDPNSFKVAIVDSGFDVNHEDSPCVNVDDLSSTNCMGKTFGDIDEEWYAPKSSHGTHVGGIVGAVTGNGIGVDGMLSDSDGVCFLMAQIFGATGGARHSIVLEAVEWAMGLGAKVINLSLGGDMYIQTSEEFFADVRAQGVLVVSASGNDGSTAHHYPASYSSVISVSAVDPASERAWFSQYNDEVDIAAPGAAILSTVPVGLGSIGLIDIDGKWFQGALMTGSPPPPEEGISGPILDCPNFGIDICEGNGNGGHVCLIDRGGGLKFNDKASACAKGGGIAAVVVNNSPGVIAGQLTDPNADIPVIGISPEDGAYLREQLLGITAVLSSVAGYSYQDGTSMSTPFVAGALTAIWRFCQSCSAEEVAECLLSTAKDLGDPGRDDVFGYGLLQTRSAFRCLSNSIGCCDRSSQSTEPKSSPTTYPTAALVAPPTYIVFQMSQVILEEPALILEEPTN